jgi:hypothetical protein
MMSDNVKIFCFADETIGEFLTNTRTDLFQSLVDEFPALQKDFATDPASDGSKDAVTVLLATATLAAVLQPALKRLLEGLLYRPVRVTELVPVELPLQDGITEPSAKAGNAISWVEQTKIIQTHPPKERVKVVTGFMGFKFEYESKPEK